MQFVSFLVCLVFLMSVCLTSCLFRLYPSFLCQACCLLPHWTWVYMLACGSSCLCACLCTCICVHACMCVCVYMPSSVISSTDQVSTSHPFVPQREAEVVESIVLVSVRATCSLMLQSKGNKLQLRSLPEDPDPLSPRRSFLREAHIMIVTSYLGRHGSTSHRDHDNQSLLPPPYLGSHQKPRIMSLPYPLHTVLKPSQEIIPIRTTMNQLSSWVTLR